MQLKKKNLRLTGSAKKSKEGRNTDPERISLKSKVKDLEKETMVYTVSDVHQFLRGNLANCKLGFSRSGVLSQDSAVLTGSQVILVLLIYRRHLESLIG